MSKLNIRRSFMPSEESESQSNKRQKISHNDYAEITFRFNASAAKSTSTTDTAEENSVCELIKDIENITLERNNKINEMHYQTKHKTGFARPLVSKLPSTNSSACFSFKRVFEKIQKESEENKKISQKKKTLNTSASFSMNSSFNSMKETQPKKLKDILFDKKTITLVDKEKVGRNIRNIASLKKAKILNNTNVQNTKIVEEEEYNIFGGDYDENEEATPKFSKDKFRDISPIQEEKEFENDNCFMPKVKTGVNFSLFHDLNPNLKNSSTNNQFAKNKVWKPTKNSGFNKSNSLSTIPSLKDFTSFKARPMPNFFFKKSSN